MPPPSRSPRPAGRNRSSESRLMLRSKKNDEDVDDLFLFTEMKKHESESSAETTHFSARRRDSPKASDGGKNEYNWLLTPPGTPVNGTDRESKPIKNPPNKARTQTTTRRSSNRKTQTREPSSRSSNGNMKAKEKQNVIVCVGGTNSHPVPVYDPSEQTFGGVIDSTQETSVDTFSKHQDQNAQVCATESETAAELSKTTEAQRNFASEGESAAIEPENQMALTEISRPQLVKSASDLKYFRYVYYKRNKNLQVFNSISQEFNTKKTLSNNKELVKLPKIEIESKCNCSIM